MKIKICEEVEINCPAEGCDNKECPYFIKYAKSEQGKMKKAGFCALTALR